MARLDARALAALVVVLSCGTGDRGARSSAVPESGTRRAAMEALTVAPAGDITGSLFQPAAPGWFWAPNVAGSGGLHLVVWVVSDGVQTDLVGARVTADGALLDPAGIVISSAPGDQKATAVAGGEAGWVVAWVDLRSGLYPTGTNAVQGDVYAARVALDGTVLDPDGIPVATGGVLRTDPGVGFAGASWLVTWKEGNGFAGALVGEAGDAGAPFAVAASAGTVGFSDLSCGGTTCLQAWTRYDPATGERDVEGARVDAALGTAIDLAPFAIAAAPGRQDAPKASFDGRDFVVVYEDSRAGAGYDVYAARVSQAGGVLDPEGISMSTAHSTVPGRPAVAFDGRNFVVEWRDSRDGSADLDLRVRTLAPDGALLGDETLVFDGVPGARLARIGSAGSGRALIAFTEDVDGTATLHGRIVIDDDARPDLGLQVILGPVVQVDSPTGGGSFQRGAFASSDAGYLAAWQQPSTVTPPYTTDIYAARVDEAGNVLDPGGFVVSAAAGRQAFQAAVWAGTHWVLLWEDTRTSYTGELYGARVTPDGVVLDQDGILVAGGDGVTRRAPDLAFDGTRLVAVWIEANDRIAAAVLDPTTLQPLAPPFAVGSFPPGAAYRFPRVNCGGGSCLVAWSHTGGGDGDVYAARVAAGSLVDPVPIPICELPGDQLSGSIAWDGLGWLVAWHDGRSLSGYDVYATRVTPEGVVQDADGFAVAEPRNAETSPSPVSFDGARHLVAFTDDPQGGQGFLRVMDQGGMLYDPVIQLTDMPGPIRAARVVGTRPGHAVVHFTYDDPSAPTAAHVYVRSLELRPLAFPLTVARSGDGAGTVTSSPAGIDCGAACTAELPGGSTVTLTARAASGSVFSGWSGACTGTAATCTVAMDEARTVGASFSLVTFPLTVRTSGSGRGTVTGDGISCTTGSSAGCSASFAAGTPVTLTAAPEAESIFWSWSGCTSVSGNVCTVSMTGARTATATFQPATWLLTVRTSGAGRGTVTGDGISCTSGSAEGCTTSVPNTSPATLVTLTATPEAGSIHSSWSGCASVSGDVCTVSMAAARTATATFQPSTYPLTLNSTGGGGGTVFSETGFTCAVVSGVPCSGTFANGETVVLTASPDTSSVFKSWSGCASVSGTTCTVTMTAARTVTVRLEPSTYLLTVTANGSGTVDGPGILCSAATPEGCSAMQANGATVTLTATPGADAILKSWSGCASVSGASCTVSMTGARAVTATFQPATYLLTAVVGGTGGGTITGPGISCGMGATDCTEPVPNGASVTLTATPGADAIFKSWSGCTSASGTTCTVSMTGARTVTATFQSATWLLTVVTGGTGMGTVTGDGISCTTGSAEGCSASVPNTSPATSVTLTATPEVGSLFSSWSGCTTVSGNVCTVSMAAARTVTATFADHTYPLTVAVTVSGSGMGTVTGPGISCTTHSALSCSTRVPITTPPTEVTLVVTQAVEMFGGWTGCTSVSGMTCTVTMDAAKTVTATIIGMPGPP